MTIIAIARLIAADGHADRALELIKGSQATCLQQPACETFDILQGADDPHHFTLVERWRSHADHKAFFDAMMQSPDTHEAMKYFAAGPEVEYFTPR